MIALLTTQIDERTTPSDLERVRRNIFDVLRELQQQRIVRVVKEGLELPDGVEVAIAHGLGRRAFVWTSPPRGASTIGRIEEVRGGNYDPTKYAVLKATGWGATVTLEVYAV